MTAVLFETPPPLLASEPLRVGGITVIERQRRQLRRAGISRVIVVNETLNLPPDTTDDIILIDSGVVLDERIIAALIAGTKPVVAVWPAAVTGVERIDAMSTAAGIGIYPAALVKTIVAGLGDWDLASTLRRAALVAGATRLDLTQLPAPAVRWARPDDAASAAAATALLLAGHDMPDDWAGRWINAPFAAGTAIGLLTTPVTPVMTAMLVLILVSAATAAFLFGMLWAGLAFALATVLLDGIHPVLARIRLDEPWLGERWSYISVHADQAWFAALGIYLGIAAHSVGPVAIAALIIGFALADQRQDGFFRRFSGTRFVAAGIVERRLRLYGSARDTRIWLLLPFALASAWLTGLVVLAAYTVVTFFIAQSRIFVRLTC